MEEVQNDSDDPDVKVIKVGEDQIINNNTFDEFAQRLGFNQKICAFIHKAESLPSVPAPMLPIVSSKEEGAVEKMVARQRALLEQVVGVLQLAVTEGTVAAERENGYLLINVRDAEPVLKAGIKASRSQIFGLRGIDPDRFTTEDRKPKVFFRIRA